MAAVAIITIAIYTVGLPLGITIWLRSKRHTLDAPSTKLELGFLYEFYGTKSGVYLWEGELSVPTELVTACTCSVAVTCVAQNLAHR